ncbi:hypothetical protein Tco_0716342 [Tanacetum coccineum]
MFLSRKLFDTLADHLQEVMVGSLPMMVDKHIKEQVENQVPKQVKVQVLVYVAKGMLLERQQNKEETDKMIAKARTSAFRLRDQDDPHDDAPLERENSAKWQKTSTSKSFKLLRRTITEIVAKRANECIVSITESDYKNLNKNDIEDIYLLIMNGNVPDYAETGIEKHKMFSIIYEPVHGIIYKNSKKEKRVMRHSEIHKLYDAVLEGLKSYNNDVKYGYKQRDLTEDEVEYLKLFEEEIEVRLKYCNQMRRWEIYVNGRPLGPQRERPE